MCLVSPPAHQILERMQNKFVILFKCFATLRMIYSFKKADDIKKVKRDITISTNITPTAISVIITCLNVTIFVELHVTRDCLSLFL